MMKCYRWLIPIALIFGFVFLFLNSGSLPKSCYHSRLLEPSYSLFTVGHQTYPQCQLSIPTSLPNILYLLLNPPIPLIYLWLLAQVYRHAYQPGERFKPYQLAAIVILPITLIQIFGIVGWIKIYDQTVGVPAVAQDNATLLLWIGVSLLSVLCAALGAVYICRKRRFSLPFQWQMIRSVGEVSLIIAFGMTGGFLFWCLIVSMLLCFVVYRFALERYLSERNSLIPLAELDQIVLDQMSVTVIFTPVTFFSYLFNLRDSHPNRRQ